MSAAMMAQIAEVLKVDVQYFFDELPTSVKNYREIKTRSASTCRLPPMALV
jgi:hypothetical protein